MLLSLGLGSFMDHFDFHLVRMTTVFSAFPDDVSVCPEEHAIMVSTPGMMNKVMFGVVLSFHVNFNLRGGWCAGQHKGNREYETTGDSVGVFHTLSFCVVVRVATSAALSVAKAASNTNRPMG